MAKKEYIEIQGAKANNLKNVNVSIPRGEFVVVTGLSGSGKSSLAFDTLYAEGQRRYMDTLSTYAKHFMGILEKPEVEDITGLSVRNGSMDAPVNLNGVPLDYIPGMILCAGILNALKKQMTEGGSYTVTGSLTRGGYWLHECTDLWEREKMPKEASAKIVYGEELSIWQDAYLKVEGTSVGDVYFPAPATNIGRSDNAYRKENMHFKDGNLGFRNS